MSYRVRIESFEGPFDLLLYLVSRQKVSIGSISLSEITDQYLAEVQRMRNVDLDVASDFSPRCFDVVGNQSGKFAAA